MFKNTFFSVLVLSLIIKMQSNMKPRWSPNRNIKAAYLPCLEEHCKLQLPTQSGPVTRDITKGWTPEPCVFNKRLLKSAGVLCSNSLPGQQRPETASNHLLIKTVTPFMSGQLTQAGLYRLSLVKNGWGGARKRKVASSLTPARSDSRRSCSFN